MVGSSVLPLVQPGDVDGSRPVHRALDPVAIGVVNEGGAAAAGNIGQAVFVVIGQGACHTCNRASRLVAIAIIGKRVAKGRSHGVGFAAAVGVAAAGVVGDVADTVVSIRMIVLAGSSSTGRGGNQAVEPVITEALGLVAVAGVRDRLYVAHVVVAVVQFLDVFERGVFARFQHIQTQRAGVVIIFAGEAVAALVQAQFDGLAQGVVAGLAEVADAAARHRL